MRSYLDEFLANPKNARVYIEEQQKELLLERARADAAETMLRELLTVERAVRSGHMAEFALTAARKRAGALLGERLAKDTAKGPRP